jgi:hypothetical protein
MGMSPKLLRPRASGFDPRSISGLALWLDAADTSSLYTTDAGPVTAVSAPTEISGCVGWWDGADATSMFDAASGGSQVAPGGVISRWQDKSGRNNHATATTTARPTLTAAGLNGRSVVTFDGSANAMTVPANADFNSNDVTYFVVFRQVSAANKGVYTKLSAVGGTLGFGLAVRSDPSVWMLQKNAGSSQVLTASVNPTTATRIYTVTSTTAANGFLDGLVSASASGQTADHSLNQAVTIGARATSEYLNGYIAEIIHFNVALSTTDRARVEAYLAAKWGIAGVHAQATATNDPVGYWRDKSGGGRHARQSGSSTRPVLRTADTNGKPSLLFAMASGQVMQPTPANPLASASAGTMVCVCRSTSNTAQSGGPVAKFGSVSTNDHYGYGAQNAVYYGFGSTTRRGPLSSALTTLAQTHILSVISSAGQWELWQNSARAFSDSVNTVGWDTSGYGIGGAFNAGVSSGIYFGGNICEVLLYSKALSSSERRRLEVYLASKWGITALAPQVTNADAQDWISRVYANGGSVSSATASAVNQFCVDIANAGIRDRFYRLNLFCGNSDASLVAVRTPLYRGPSLSGTQYGGATDTNASFAAATDYAETGANGGLKGDGSTKFLNTGFPANAAALGDRHLAVYERVKSSSTYKVSIGARTQVTSPFFWELETLNLATTYGAYGGNTAVAASSLNYTGGAMWLASQSSASSLSLYKNGSLAASSSSVNATNTYSGNVYVFALNEAGNTYYHSDGRFGGYSIGLAMTDAQAAAYYTAMQAFQTALSRQV